MAEIYILSFFWSSVNGADAFVSDWRNNGGDLHFI